MQAGCPRLYPPYPWEVPIQRESVQPLYYKTFAPSVLALEWSCLAVYICGVAFSLLVMRWSYFLARDGRGASAGVEPSCVAPPVLPPVLVALGPRRLCGDGCV